MLPTVMFGGYGRAGKDTAGKYLGKISPLRYVGSLSWRGKAIVALQLGICEQEAWDTRHQCREDWKRILDDYRKDDQSRLVRLSLVYGEIVVGLRDKTELQACRAEKLLNHFVWIDNPSVPEDFTTTYRPSDCDVTILNDSTIEEFHKRLRDWFISVKIPLLP